MLSTQYVFIHIYTVYIAYHILYFVPFKNTILMDKIRIPNINFLETYRSININRSMFPTSLEMTSPSSRYSKPYYVNTYVVKYSVLVHALRLL